MRMPKAGSIVSLLSIALLAVVGSSYLTFGVAKLRPFDDRAKASLILGDAANLVPRSPVLLFGVKMGEVRAVETMREGVRVRFQLDEGVRIPVNSTATIESLSTLSEAYIDFQADSLAGPYITAGQTVSGTRVRSAQSVPEVARSVTTLLRQLDPKAFSSLVGTFSEALSGTETLVPQLSKAADLLAATLMARQPQLRELMINAQAPGAGIGRAGEQLAAAGPEWDRFGVEVTKVVSSIGDLLHARQPLSVYREGNGLVPYLGKLERFVDKIGPDMQKLYPVLGPLIRMAGEAVEPLDISALISQALKSVSPDGRVRLTISVK